jgi:Zn-dependent protease
VDLTIILLSVPALLFSLCFHEYGHARMATWLGDTTPSRQGRLTLSPTAHVDPFGTILFPGIAILLSAVYRRRVPFLGWAKPVQFVPTNFTRKVSMWQGSALCALAGPGANFLLAIVAALVLRVALTLHPALQLFLLEAFHAGGVAGNQHTPAGFALGFVVVLLEVNVTLGFFNLFPMPPLDGGYLIPRRHQNVRDWLARHSFVLFVVLFFVPIPGLGDTLGWLVLRPPIDFVTRGLLALSGM